MTTKRNEKRLRAALLRVAQTLYPKGEQTDAAQRLIAAFGSPSAALEAPESELCSLCALREPLAFTYSITADLSRYLLCERANANRTILSVRDVRPHLLGLYLGMHYECGHLLSLTKDGRLLGIDPLRMGSIDEAPFYTRIIIENALLSGGEVFVLSHNHPGGTPFASTEDCRSTLNVMNAMNAMGLLLLDHIILDDGQTVSIRECGSISERIWNALSPIPAPFSHWFS